MRSSRSVSLPFATLPYLGVAGVLLGCASDAPPGETAHGGPNQEWTVLTGSGEGGSTGGGGSAGGGSTGGGSAGDGSSTGAGSSTGGCWKDHTPRMARLPCHFGIGVKNAPGEIGSMANAPWEYRYQYVNPGWKTWNSPAGAFVDNYAKQGKIPIFTWYILGGGPHGYPGAGLFNDMRDAAVMNQYYSDFALALQNAASSGAPAVIFQIEPDLWGFMQQNFGDDPQGVPVSVASSGYPGLGALPNDASGFARALLAIRDANARDVIVGINISTWGANYYPTNGADPIAAGNRVVHFYHRLAAKFDMLFYDPSDADAGYKVNVRNNSAASAWWTDASYASFQSFVGTIYKGTGLRGMSWQVPVGNTIYKSLNNSTNHYQDNHAQYFLQPENRQHIANFADAGLIGLLFGNGQWNSTDYLDYAGDGVTNPNSINGNSQASNHSDDDGGYLRQSTSSYYSAGPTSIP